MTTPKYRNDSNDDSIIDISDQLFKANSANGLKKYKTGVPFWRHIEAHSIRGINGASVAQKNFYKIFKYSFLRGEYFDLEGNTNYAFVLYFELLEEFVVHKDVCRLESQIKILGQCYPQTRTFGISYLMERIERMEIKEDHEETSNFITESLDNDEDFDDEWGLGSMYQDKLKLSVEAARHLNMLDYPDNNFSCIEHCCMEMIKLYLALMSKLKAAYIMEGTTMEAQFNAVAEIVVKKQYRHKAGSLQYNQCIDETLIDFCCHIFEYCEHTVRERYGYIRATHLDTCCPAAKDEIESKIISKVKTILSVLIHTVAPPDEETEIELHLAGPTRCRTQFEELTTGYNNQPKEFVEAIVAIAKFNEENPEIESVFFDAAKFMAKHDRDAALSLYVHYAHYNIGFSHLDIEPLPKRMEKKFFKTQDQYFDFEIIIDDLYENLDLDNALKELSKLFEVKRKKIELNTASIKKAQQQHSGTVELLNEYLKDDLEEENSSVKSQEINSREIKIEITQKNKEIYPSPFVSELSFTPIHAAMLELFAKSNFTISANEIEIFAKSKGVFKNYLIESINDKCYDFLNDLLIEEENDYYTINTNYFQRISTQ